ncbi:hypothetical protein ABZ436_24865 [Micromonospora matsumotoense]|uniref:hypothetical protein n=1 Tax=Micromonospora matsumotoense TaxID=121616 RepID=UPI003405C540
MRDRWRAVGVLAAALFAVNVLARVIIKLGFDGNDTAADRVSLGMFIVVGLVLAGVVLARGRVVPAARWGADVAAAVVVALLLTVLVGPLLVGNNPFGGGAGLFFAQIWLYLAAAAAGVAIGYLVLIALGRDHRSRQLQRYAERNVGKPRRVVRR